MSEKYQAPRGTNDILPGPLKEPVFEVHKWQHLEVAFDKVCRTFGYREIRTPMFEDVDLFIRSSGETSDVVSKEMYEFQDKGGRDLALKPEGTAPVMRAYLEHGLANRGGLTRLWYKTHSFRYGRPGKGRYRQLHQLGVELVGSSAPGADAEVIELAYRFLADLILTPVVRINSVGDFEARRRYGELVLEALASWLPAQPVEFQAMVQKNPVRQLDSKSPEVQGLLAGLPPISECVSDAGKEHFCAVQDRLTEAGVAFAVDPSIVRGLDYYNDTVFEIFDLAFSDSLALCGGGRYDSLVSQLGGPPTACVGFGIGIERTILSMDEGKIEMCEPQLDAFIVAAGDDAWRPARQLCADIRAAGLSCLYDVDQRKLKNQFKEADRSRAKYALVIGDEELANGKVTVKVLETGEQTSVDRSGIISFLQS